MNDSSNMNEETKHPHLEQAKKVTANVLQINKTEDMYNLEGPSREDLHVQVSEKGIDKDTYGVDTSKYPVDPNATKNLNSPAAKQDKVSIGDKISGTLKQVTGKITKNEAKQEAGVAQKKGEL